MTTINRTNIRRTFPIETTRNIGIAAHIDAGKTTLTERMLLHAGTIHHAGDVHRGDTTMDFDPLEQRKGITISAAAISSAWATRPEAGRLFGGMRHRINIIDTPGHVDFTAEVERSMRVLDGAVAVLSGVEGVQPQTERVWRQATRYGVPRIAFVNKMDRVGASFGRVLHEMRTKLRANAWPVLLPLGSEHQLRGQIDVIGLQAILHDGTPEGDCHITELTPTDRGTAIAARAQLVEALAEIDPEIADAYLAGRDPEARELRLAIRRQTIANRFIPVVGGSAFKYVGVQGLLDAVVEYLPSPVDLPPATGTDPETCAVVEIRAADAEPLRALVFKLSTDEDMRRHVFVRVYSGVLHPGDAVLNSVTGKRERISRVSEIHADKEHAIEAAFAGDICVVSGLKDVATGYTLCAEDAPVLLEPPSFPQPMVAVAIEPVSRKDQERLSTVLQRLTEDDPTLKLHTDPETGQVLLSGMGELHLEVTLMRMRETYRVETRSGAPKIAYRETITVPAGGEAKYVRQSGGNGQYGHVVVQIAPSVRGSGITVTDKVVGGRIPRQFIASVKKGILDAASNGPLGGYPVVDVDVQIVDGSSHSKDSNDLAFQIAGSLALKDAVAKAQPVLLEPVMAVETTTPAEYQGDLMGDLSRRRGTVRDVAPEESAVHIAADVPLADMFGYANAIRSLSKGRAEYAMELGRFEIVPAEVAAKALAKR